MKTVILYGELAKRFGKHHRFDVRNVSEALRALKANFRGFEQYMCSAHQHNVGFKVFTGRHNLSDYKEVHDPIGEVDVIRIVPAIIGASGFFKVLLGVLLIGAGLLFGAAPLVQAGAGLVIGGVAQLLTPAPAFKAGSEPDRKQSHIFNGHENTTAQGKSVPVGYGRMIVGSVVISAGITTYES